MCGRKSHARRVALEDGGGAVRAGCGGRADVNDRTLFDDFEYSGNWWLPGREEDTVGGTVSYKDGILMLELFDPFFVDGSRKAPDEDLQPELILGQSRGIKITLFKTRGLPVNPSSTTFFRAKYLFKGKHFDPEEVVLTSLSVRFTHLEEWLDKRPFEVDIRGGSGGRGSIEYVPPDPIEFDLPQKDCHLRIVHTSNSSMGGYRSIRWGHAAWINISTENPKQADWYPDTAISLSQVLGLLVGRTVAPIAMMGHVVGEHDRIEDGLVQGAVDIFRDSFDRPSQKECEMPWPRRVLVTFPALGASAGDVLNSWFEHAEKAQPVYNLYLATLSGESTYVEIAFLSLTQALEGFHRRFVRAKASFKARLSELFELFGDDVRTLISEDPEGFAEGVKNTRNYLTHYFDEGEESRGWAEDFPALSEATYRLRRMFAALLWHQVGIDPGVVRDAVSKIDIDPYQTR